MEEVWKVISMIGNGTMTFQGNPQYHPIPEGDQLTRT
jgi:hypothetical protein